MYIVMLGGPGSGKGTVSDKLSTTYNIKHISTGDILREEIKKQTKIGNEVKNLLAEGKLVPDKVVTQLLIDKLSSKECESGAILDGYPRTENQAKTLEKILLGFGKKVNYAIELDVSDEIIIERIINRRLCPNKDCGAIYNTKFNPSLVEGICDKCGSTLITRPDDNKETIENRLKIYHSESTGIINYYKQSGTLLTIHPQKNTTPNEIISEIVKEIKA